MGAKVRAGQGRPVSMETGEDFMLGGAGLLGLKAGDGGALPETKKCYITQTGANSFK